MVLVVMWCCKVHVCLLLFCMFIYLYSFKQYINIKILLYPTAKENQFFPYALKWKPVECESVDENIAFYFVLLFHFSFLCAGCVRLFRVFNFWLLFWLFFSVGCNTKAQTTLESEDKLYFCSRKQFKWP